MQRPLQENQYIEFKSEAVKAMHLAEEIVAFANSEGGEIWLGIEDDGSISGLSRSYEEDVMNIGRTLCIPPLRLIYEPFEIDGRQVARVQIPSGKDKPYYTIRRHYFIRIGSTKRIASHEELMRLFQASGAFHYDLVEIDRARITDLDLGQIGQYFTRHAINFFETNLLTPSAIVGVKRIDTPPYPDRVLRELIVNACVHRNYSLSGANIRVFVFSDRLEVISPGRLPNTVSIEKLSIGTSFARNPVLVRFMQNLGYVDKLGRGLPMVCQEAAKLGRQVQFLEHGEEFRVMLPL